MATARLLSHIPMLSLSLCNIPTLSNPHSLTPTSTNKSRNNNMRLNLKQLIAARPRRIRARRLGLPICKSF